ncbi:MAG: hypothetical protein VCA38_11805, partial [Roseibacillus sp.]
VKAVLFTPNGEAVCDFYVTSYKNIPKGLFELRKQGTEIPDWSYVEAFGSVWTVVDNERLRVEEARSPAASWSCAAACQSMTSLPSSLMSWVLEPWQSRRSYRVINPRSTAPVPYYALNLSMFRQGSS